MRVFSSLIFIPSACQLKMINNIFLLLSLYVIFYCLNHIGNLNMQVLYLKLLPISLIPCG